MEGRSYRPGEVIVARAERARFAHPLRGTDLARRLRRSRRWALAMINIRRHNARLPADAPALRFYPLRPQPRASIIPICARLGRRITFGATGAGTPIAWDDGHSFSPRAARRLAADAINGRCLDVSKSHVDEVWAQVAGYGVSVDPLTTAQPIVIKSELNGTHDGRLVMGPLPSRQAGFVYQRLIDGRRDGRIYATRAMICGEQIPLAFEKWRPYPNWFHGGSVVEPAMPAELYTSEEIALLLRFAAAIGMEYGELDVLRERETGRIYVVDANRTPIRPIGLASEHDQRVYELMADAFAPLLEEGRAA